MLAWTVGPQAAREAAPIARGTGLVIMPWDSAVLARAAVEMRLLKCILALRSETYAGGNSEIEGV